MSTPPHDDPSLWRATLLGGALGDALGAPVEFGSIATIREHYGPAGITEPEAGNVLITDDTQMTLFTAEALLGAARRHRSYGIASTENALHYSYLRWLATQGVQAASTVNRRPLELRGLLWECAELHNQRAPGGTCIDALRSGRFGTPAAPLGNNSKGCGGVMRAAPGARFGGFHAGALIGAITHGHPSGFLAAGAFAQILVEVIAGRGLGEGVEAALGRLRDEPEGGETGEALEKAVELAGRVHGDEAVAVESLGGGWVAEEALAIAVYAASRADGDFARGVRIAVNHSGDSDSTGAIAGNLLGAMLGEEALPAAWLETLEARDVIAQVGTDLGTPIPEDDDPGWSAHAARYPYM